MDKRKRLLSAVRSFVKKYGYIFILAVPFLLMDMFMRIIGHEINYFRASMVLPNILFIVIWIGFFLGLALNLRGITGKILYWIFFILYFVLFMTNAIYYTLTGFFFSFNLMFMAGEGSSYILDTLIHTSPLVYLMCLVVLVSAIFCARVFPKKKKSDFKALFVICVSFVILHIITPFTMGVANESLEWDTWRNPHNVYNNFNDANKCMKICGIYEYAVRDFYTTFLKPEEPEKEEDLEFLEEAYSSLARGDENEYTNMFDGKNVIFLQLEGLDTWLFNEADTPNLYGMLDHSFVFTNHYSYYNGGGSTFNSELAVNTGLITPISYVQNAYSFNRNYYEYSLAALFKEIGYSVNAFHMNTKEYYSRGTNYKNWGYDNYYSLLDENSYSDLTYELDSELILDDKFYDRMFRQDGKFLHYIITYTPHTPFTTQKGVGKLLAKEIYGEDAIPDLSEEESARLFASETDRMVGLLLQALKDNDLYDNTVIVAYADHYLYTLNDKTILDKYKETDNNLINHTPFFIWSSDIERTDVDKVNSQLDILPTVLNLFGLGYIQEYYIGSDIFDEDYEGYVFFSDGSWFDGTVYTEDGEITGYWNGEKNVSDISLMPEGVKKKYDAQEDGKTALDTMNEHINTLIRKNDLTLKYDYFRRRNQ